MIYENVVNKLKLSKKKCIIIMMDGRLLGKFPLYVDLMYFLSKNKGIYSVFELYDKFRGRCHKYNFLESLRRLRDRGWCIKVGQQYFYGCPSEVERLECKLRRCKLEYLDKDKELCKVIDIVRLVSMIIERLSDLVRFVEFYEMVCRYKKVPISTLHSCIDRYFKKNKLDYGFRQVYIGPVEKIQEFTKIFQEVKL